MGKFSSAPSAPHSTDPRVQLMHTLHQIFSPFENAQGVIDDTKLRPVQPQWYLVCAARSLFWALDASSAPKQRLGNLRAAAEDLVRYRHVQPRLVLVGNKRRADRSLNMAEADAHETVREGLTQTEVYLAEDIAHMIRYVRPKS